MQYATGNQDDDSAATARFFRGSIEIFGNFYKKEEISAILVPLPHTRQRMYHTGEIILVAFTYAPSEFFPCDGRILSISSYTALYSLVGSTYGGDGRTTFALPLLTAPTGLRYLICNLGDYPERP